MVSAGFDRVWVFAVLRDITVFCPRGGETIILSAEDVADGMVADHENVVRCCSAKQMKDFSECFRVWFFVGVVYRADNIVLEKWFKSCVAQSVKDFEAWRVRQDGELYSLFAERCECFRDSFVGFQKVALFSSVRCLAELREAFKRGFVFDAGEFCDVPEEHLVFPAVVAEHFGNDSFDFFECRGKSALHHGRDSRFCALEFHRMKVYKGIVDVEDDCFDRHTKEESKGVFIDCWGGKARKQKVSKIFVRKFLKGNCVQKNNEPKTILEHARGHVR